MAEEEEEEEEHPPPSDIISAQKYATLAHHFNKGAEPTISKIPPSYILVSKAGGGIFGDVFFCLAASASTFTGCGKHTTTITTTTTDVSSAKAHLTSKLVAVKVPSVFEKQGLNRELRALKVMQTYTQAIPPTTTVAAAAAAAAATRPQQFFQLMEYDTKNQFAEWAVTSTLPLCCNLLDLEPDFPSLPEDFVWLVYTQIHSAVEFLHQKCGPPIAHGDLHLGNIVIGFSSATAVVRSQQTGLLVLLPEIKLVDFGLSFLRCEDEEEEEEEEEDHGQERVLAARLRHDAKSFLCVMDNLIHTSRWSRWDSITCRQFIRLRRPENRSATFYAFHKALGTGLAWMEVETVVLKQLWDMFGASAMHAVEHMSNAAREKIRNVVLGFAGPRFQRTQERIGEILAEL